MCSRTLGPATFPSFVTWPTIKIDTPSPLAICIRIFVDSRTWGNTSGGGTDLFVEHGLDRIHHNRIRLSSLDHFSYRLKIRLAEDLQILIEFPDTVRPHPDLAGRFLSGNIQNVLPVLGKIPAHL